MMVDKTLNEDGMPKEECICVCRWLRWETELAAYDGFIWSGQVFVWLFSGGDCGGDKRFVFKLYAAQLNKNNTNKL